MSGGGGSTKNVTQNYSPEEVAARKAVQDEAARVYAQTKDQIGAYPGATVVPLGPDTLAAQEMARKAAETQGLLNQQAVGATQFGLSGAMDVENNPYLAKAVQGAIRPITESFTDAGGVMSQIRNNAVANGTFGGTRQGIAEGIAAGRYADAVGDVTSKMYSDAYGKGLDTFGKTLALTPQTIGAQTAPSQTLSAVGAQNENVQQEQAQYDALVKEWAINAPWMPLQNYADMIYGGGSSQSMSKSQTPRQPMMGAAGGALGGYALGSMMAGATEGSTLGPWGAAAGAIIGLLMS